MASRIVLCVLICAAPAFAQAPPPPRFEVASLKQNTSGAPDSNVRIQGGGRYAWTNVTLRQLIDMAYSSRDANVDDVVGGPPWLASARWDVVAKTEDGVPVLDPDGMPGPLFAMLRTLVEERFRLQTHRAVAQRPIYALTLVKRDGRTGPRMIAVAIDCTAVTRERSQGTAQAPRPNGMPPCAITRAPGRIAGSAASLGQLTATLSSTVGRPVVDRTHLTGAFDITLEFRPEFQVGFASPPDSGAPAGAADAPSIFTALQEQLGLKLESTRGPVDVLVIDHAEKPSDN